MTHTREMLVTFTGLVGTLTSLTAAMSIWLLLTQPLTVATAVSARDLAPIASAMAGVLREALVALARYL